MPAKICNVCGNALVGAPLAVVELSTIEGRGPRLERSILCPECVLWARTFLRPTPVAQAGEVATLEPAGRA